MMLLLLLPTVLMVKHSHAHPGLGVPEFISVGYVDSHLITTYDSVTRQKEPLTGWMAENLTPDHWERYTQLLKGWEQTFKVELRHLQRHYNHSEPLVVRTSLKETFPGITTVFCRAHGFYPLEIYMTWMKNGEEIAKEVDSGNILPSGDGTYQTWVSVDLDPQSRDVYSCLVEHNGLRMVLEAPRESGTILLMMKAAFGTIILTIVLVGVGVLAWRRKSQEQHDSCINREFQEH